MFTIIFLTKIALHSCLCGSCWRTGAHRVPHFISQAVLPTQAPSKLKNTRWKIQANFKRQNNIRLLWKSFPAIKSNDLIKSLAENNDLRLIFAHLWFPYIIDSFFEFLY